MKKFLSVLLSLCLILSLCLFPAGAEGEPTVLKVLGYENYKDQFATIRDEQFVWQEAERLFAEAGLKLEYEIIADAQQYKTTIQTRLAAAHDLPDLFYGGSTDVVDLLDMGDMGIVLKINDILELSAGPAKDFWFGGTGDAARQLISDENGDFYWLPRIQVNQLNGTNAGTSIGITIRKDWLEKLGLEIPNSLDSFTEALRAFQEKDVNGNGIVDEIMLVDPSTFGCGVNLWFGIPTCDSHAIGINLTEKRVETAWYNPNLKAYFEYIKSLLDAGLISADYIGTDTSSTPAKTANTVAAQEYYPVGTYEEATVIAAGYPDAYLIGIYPFDAVEGTKGFYSEETPYLVYLRHCVSSAASDKLQAVADLYDVIYGEAYTNLMLWGVEGKTYEVLADGTRHRLNGALDRDQKGAAGVQTVNGIAKFMLPDFNFNERAEEISRTAEAGWQAKMDYELETADYQPRTPNDNSGYYALGTTEEDEILAEYGTDLATASRELAANICLGVVSLDDLDAEIEELKELGLDEILAVRQAQYARGQGMQSYEALGEAFWNN